MSPHQKRATRNPQPVTHNLTSAARRLKDACNALTFGEPVWAVYNPLDYAWAGHEAYLERFGHGRKQVVYLGMNPGPWGMAQTGVPFGEIPAVRDWMGLQVDVGHPPREHPKRRIEGFDCQRSEVSGRRLWGLFAELYGTAESFFAQGLVLNYCPLSFLLETGANLTPDRLPVAERAPLEAECDAHLKEVLAQLNPDWAVGIGGFATKCLQRIGFPKKQIGTLLHPSPASPIANREWPERPKAQLRDLGLIS